MPGIGMGFPSLCQEVMEGILQGAYGPNLKRAFEAGPLMGVCAEEKLYVCDECGRWAMMPDATLYEPLDARSMVDERYGEQTVREWGYIPYLMPRQLKRYRVACAYEPTCECGSTMRGAELKDGLTLTCPSCGASNQVDGFAGCWD